MNQKSTDLATSIQEDSLHILFGEVERLLGAAALGSSTQNWAAAGEERRADEQGGRSDGRISGEERGEEPLRADRDRDQRQP